MLIQKVLYLKILLYIISLIILQIISLHWHDFSFVTNFNFHIIYPRQIHYYICLISTTLRIHSYLSTQPYLIFMLKFRPKIYPRYVSENTYRGLKSNRQNYFHFTKPSIYRAFRVLLCRYQHHTLNMGFGIKMILLRKYLLFCVKIPPLNREY